MATLPQGPIHFSDYNEQFLQLSWHWLRDEEIKELTRTPDFTREEQAQWYSTLPDNKNYQAFGIWWGGKAIGVCGIKNITDKDAEYFGYIGEKEYWGKGVGMSMIKHIEQEAIQLGLSSVYLRVWNGNTRAINLYRKMGYTTFNIEDELRFMRKELSA